MALIPYALTRPFLFGLDPERAHELTLDAIASQYFPFPLGEERSERIRFRVPVQFREFRTAEQAERFPGDGRAHGGAAFHRFDDAFVQLLQRRLLEKVAVGPGARHPEVASALNPQKRP